MTDLFAHKSKEYDKGSRRVANVNAIVTSVIENVTLDKNMHLMDFGAGTGLLLSGIASYVGKITAVDVSSSMIAVLKEKRDTLPCELDIIQADMTVTDIEQDNELGGLSNELFDGLSNELFDGIISSMTLHHIEDVPAILAKFKSLLKANGFIALADLDSEDGSFHSGNPHDTGVFHNGFEREYIMQIAKDSGFGNVKVTTANEFNKNGSDYSVFLLTGCIE